MDKGTDGWIPYKHMLTGSMVWESTVRRTLSP
jgi:hypothetical protein